MSSLRIYQRRSEADSKTLARLGKPTPEWLDRDYPYVPPPDEGGTLRELQFLLSLVPERTENSEFIRKADEDFLSLFVDLCRDIGTPISRQALDAIVADSAILITKLKWLYNRPRPFQVAQKYGVPFTQMSSDTANTPAYPGGHTTQSYLIADYLSEIAPQHSRMFMDLASKISWSRALGGFHWPSDLLFGKSIYRSIVNENLPSTIRVAAGASDRSPEKYSGEVFYFAYGSNLWPPQLKTRLPEAIPAGRAVLPDHELTYSSGVAAVVPREGSAVSGVLFLIPDSELRSLDLREGALLGRYRRGLVKVYTEEGAPMRAVTYLAENRNNSAPPSENYAEKLDLGRKYWGLTAKLTQTEKEEREDKRLIQKSPKKKPPRDDLRRKISPGKEKDPDKEQDKKDRSNNYKDASDKLYLNTSNPNKLREFKRLGLSDLEMLGRDLKEPDSDPLTVIRSKASQMGPNVLVEDTSLDVEGEDVGVNVKWLMSRVGDFIGKKAVFRCMIGILRNGFVEVYVGEVPGTIVEPRGEGFGFDPIFLPDGAHKTLGEEKSDRYNARALAVRKFLQGHSLYRLQPLLTWDGAWQGEVGKSASYKSSKSKLMTVRRKEDGKSVQVTEKTLQESPHLYEVPDDQDLPSEDEPTEDEEIPDLEDKDIAPIDEKPPAKKSLESVRSELLDKYKNLGDKEVGSILESLKDVEDPEALESAAESKLKTEANKSESLLKSKGGLEEVRKKLLDEYTSMGLSEKEVSKTLDLIQEGLEPDELDELRGTLTDRATQITKDKKLKEDLLSGGVRTPAKLENFREKVDELYSQNGVDSDHISEILESLKPGSSKKEIEEVLSKLDSKSAEIASQKENKELQKAWEKIRSEPLRKALALMPEGGRNSEVSAYLSKISPEEFESFQEALEKEFKETKNGWPDNKKDYERVLKNDSSALSLNGDLQKVKDPVLLGKAFARLRFKQEVLDDPTVDLEDPLPKKGTPPSPEDSKKALSRAEKSVGKYRKLSQDKRQESLDLIDQELDVLEDVPDEDPRKLHLKAIRKGIGVASILEDGKDAEGVGGSMATLVRAAERSGTLKKILALGESREGNTAERVDQSRDDQELMRDVYKSLDDYAWAEIIPEDHPGYDWAKLLGPDSPQRLPPGDRDEIRECLADLMLGEFEFLEPAIDENVDSRETRGQREDIARRARGDNQPSPGDNRRNWVLDYLSDLAAKATGKVKSVLRSRKAPEDVQETPPEDQETPSEEEPEDQETPSEEEPEDLDLDLEDEEESPPARVARKGLKKSRSSLGRFSR